MTRNRRRFTYALAILSLAFLSGSDATESPTSVVRAPIPPAAYTQIASYLEAQATALSADQIAELARVIHVEARSANIDPQLVLAVIHVESSGNPRAVSHAGAMGLMQLRPSTAESVAARAGVMWNGPRTLFDPTSNIRMGVVYLCDLIDRFGDIDTALAAYNWGPTHIARQLRRGRTIPAGYSTRVLSTYQTAYHAPYETTI